MHTRAEAHVTAQAVEEGVFVVADAPVVPRPRCRPAAASGTVRHSRLRRDDGTDEPVAPTGRRSRSARAAAGDHLRLPGARPEIGRRALPRRALDHPSAGIVAERLAPQLDSLARLERRHVDRRSTPTRRRGVSCRPARVRRSGRPPRRSPRWPRRVFTPPRPRRRRRARPASEESRSRPANRSRSGPRCPDRADRDATATGKPEVRHHMGGDHPRPGSLGPTRATSLTTTRPLLRSGSASHRLVGENRRDAIGSGDASTADGSAVQPLVDRLRPHRYRSILPVDPHVPPRPPEAPSSSMPEPKQRAVGLDQATTLGGRQVNDRRTRAGSEVPAAGSP